MPSALPCCPVSQEPYEADGPNKPRTLPCGHSISHGALAEILRHGDADRRLCPIDRKRLHHTDAAAYPINYAIVEIIGTLPARDTPDGPAAPAAAADPAPGLMLPQPPATAAMAAPVPDLSFADVMPGGSAARVEDGVWRRIEQAYLLPSDAVDGSPSDWSVLGWTAAGHCVYRGFDRSGGGIPRAVALCYAATLPGGDSAEANGRTLRAAVAPHVALQLLPDVRPLLPALHGFMVAATVAGGGTGSLGGTGPLGGRDKQVWMVYSMHGQCLALHLEQQPQHFVAPKLVVSMLRQLASAIEAMHRNNLTSSTLHPITIASVCLDTIDGPSSVRIAPYAREIPAEELGFSSTGAFQELCIPPEAGPAGSAGEDAAADVWRVAAVAAIALSGDTLKQSLDGSTPATPAMLVAAVRTLRQNAVRLPAELADILEGCLHCDPRERWTADRMHTALLSESLDSQAPAAAPVHAATPLAHFMLPPQPAPQPAHVAVALHMQEGENRPATGHRPTPQNRSICGACIVRTCYTAGFIFAVLVCIATLSAIFG